MLGAGRAGRRSAASPSLRARHARGGSTWPSVVISALIGAVTIQAAAKAAGDAKLRLAQAEVERLAKLAERERIARDLHDLLGHTLSVVVLKSELAQKLMARDPARARQEMAEVERIARDGPGRGARGDHRLSLVGPRAPRSSTCARRWSPPASTTTIEARAVPLAPAQETALSLALREATTNVIRHAGATTLPHPLLRAGWLGADGGEDNGRGGDAPFGNGLTGMRERIQALGGVLRRETDRGTRLLIKLPLIADGRPYDAIRVLIAEDQGMVLGALAALLEIEPDIEVVARAHDGREALALAARTDPDVVLTDIEMPHMTGLELAAELHRTRKGGRPRVIILTTFARPGYLRRALDAGASGYLLKDAPAEKLADAIRGVHQGLRVVDPQLAQDAWGDADPLTDRERQVLRAAEEGLASADIAERLHLSEGTVRNYLSEAIAKLGVSNRIEAARLARQRGWL